MKSIINTIIPENPVRNGFFSFLFAVLTVIVMPLHVKYLPPFMIMWCLFWIIENLLSGNIKWRFNPHYRILFILFILYYLWQVLGLLYTSDIKMGLLNLFGRLSLVLFPFVLVLPGEMIKSKIRILIRAFALSTSLYMLFCFIYALYRSITLHDGTWLFNPHLVDFPWLNYFYSAELTVSQHPSYIAMYVLLSTFICFESGFDYSLKLKNRILWLSLGVMLIFTQYFLSSRAGIMICLLLVSVYFIIRFKNVKRKRLAWITIIIIIICLLPIIVKNQRVDYLYGRIINKQAAFERKKDPRFLIWKSALQIAGKNLLVGVGIGDVRTVLALEYKRIGEEKMAEERFNAHNQFIEVLLENGIIGLFLFISIFVCMLQIALSEKNLLYGIFILMIIMFFLFETVLYRLAGVSFFSLFSFLLIHNKSNKIPLNY